MQVTADNDIEDQSFVELHREIEHRPAWVGRSLFAFWLAVPARLILPPPPEWGTGTAPACPPAGRSGRLGPSPHGHGRAPPPRRHGGRGLRRACPRPPLPGPVHPSPPTPLTAAERRSWLGSMAAARAGSVARPCSRPRPCCAGRSRKAGQRRSRAAPRAPSLPPSAAGGRRGAAVRGGGRAAREGRGGESRSSCLGARGVSLAREPGQRPRLPRSPPLGR